MSVSAGRTIDTLNRSAFARREAALDRRRASQDRQAGADERAGAELDRNTALADRRAGATGRSNAELDRNTALADRRAGATGRSNAELDRNTALADRRAGATRRSNAELDRNTALADRGASAREREEAFVDELTGVYLRGPGFAEIERDIARARRLQQTFVLAFVDIDRLKSINDSRGHTAGDRMLVNVIKTIRAKLRPYDLITRCGGDEFVCTMSGLDAAEAMKRFTLVNATLAESTEPGSVTVGLAGLQPDDSLKDLVARADASLYRQRQRQRRAHTGDLTASDRVD
jgi:diguanylate cyclase (GGDEF)-like protein